MKLVGSGFGGDVDDAGIGAPIFGGEVIGDDADFLDRIERHGLADRSGEFSVIRHAVQHNVGSRRPQTIDRHSGARPVPAPCGVVFTDVSRRDDQGIWVTRDGRKFENLLRAEHLS